MQYRSSFLMALAFLVFGPLSAQVVNIESQRIVNDQEGWAGSMGVQSNVIKNTSRLFSVGANTHVQWKKDKHLFLFLNETVFSKLDKNAFDNFSFFHLRHNYKVNAQVRWETFSQWQYNRILSIKERWLFGTGPRWKITQRDAFRMYVGTLYMFERELATDGKLEENHRLDAYCTFTWSPKKAHFKLVSTTYYQPGIAEWVDARWLNESSLQVNLVSWIAFTSTFTYLFDSRPPGSAPNDIYRWTNGLRVQFIPKKKETPTPP